VLLRENIMEGVDTGHRGRVRAPSCVSDPWVRAVSYVGSEWVGEPASCALVGVRT
jgi:hypothetical protein